MNESASMDQPDLRPFHEANRAHWDEVVPAHEASHFYDLASFKRGESSLRPLERAELGEIAGKTLLHLQCHFGMDTLSLARQGARVTGADYSSVAINRATELSNELGIPARFVLSTFDDLPSALRGTFDIVFTSYGVLAYLSDLGRWAAVISHFLKRGGTFYIAEFHPFLHTLYLGRDATELRVAQRYFHDEQPTGWPPERDYADPDANVAQGTFEWRHSMGDIVNALVGAGLRITFLHEFPFSVNDHFAFMEMDRDGWWRLPDGKEWMPMLFSLKATK